MTTIPQGWRGPNARHPSRERAAARRAGRSIWPGAAVALAVLAMMGVAAIGAGIAAVFG